MAMIWWCSQWQTSRSYFTAAAGVGKYAVGFLTPIGAPRHVVFGFKGAFFNDIIKIGFFRANIGLNPIIILSWWWRPSSCRHTLNHVDKYLTFFKFSPPKLCYTRYVESEFRDDRLTLPRKSCGLVQKIAAGGDTFHIPCANSSPPLFFIRMHLKAPRKCP
jgi:hypothetical protein